MDIGQEITSIKTGSDFDDVKGSVFLLCSKFLWAVNRKRIRNRHKQGNLSVVTTESG